MLVTDVPMFTSFLPAVPACAMVCESISNIALYVSFSFHTSTRPIITGFPVLSFTFIGSASRLRARSDSFFVVRNGFTQKYPVSVNVPLYLPKNTITRASLGSSITKPPQMKNVAMSVVTDAPMRTPPGALSNMIPYTMPAMAKKVKIRLTKSIMKPFTFIPLNANSFFSIF